MQFFHDVTIWGSTLPWDRFLLSDMKFLPFLGCTVSKKCQFCPFLAILSHFDLFLAIFVFFFSFIHLNRVIFGLQLVLSMLKHMYTIFALEKFKIRVCQGVSGDENPILSYFSLFFEIFGLFFSFTHWNRVISGLQLVQSTLKHICTVVAHKKSK